jgi:hypothetical protein
MLVAAQNRLTRSAGKKGVSAATVMTKLCSGRFALAQARPA